MIRKLGKNLVRCSVESIMACKLFLETHLDNRIGCESFESLFTVKTLTSSSEDVRFLTNSQCL